MPPFAENQLEFIRLPVTIEILEFFIANDLQLQ